MSCPSYLVALAQQIWNDLAQPADQPVSYIQSKLISPSYIGLLTTLSSDCITIVDAQPSPELTDAQQAIYRLMYERDYYVTKLNQTLAGLAPGNGAIEISEGDSRVKFINPVEMAKVYKDLLRQLNEQLNLVVATYRIDKSLPSTVVFPMIWNMVGGYGYSTIPAAGGAHGYYRS